MKLEMQSQDGRRAFEPGEEVFWLVHWELDQPVEALEMRLIWHTQGKGTRDISLAWSHRWERPNLVGDETLAMVLPEGPYTFSGKLISLSWRLELVVIPGEQGPHLDVTIAPECREVVLVEVDKS